MGYYTARILLTCVCTLVIVLPIVSCERAAPKHNLHLHLTVNELQQTFSVSEHSQVPEYDLFHARSVRRRSVGGRHRRSVNVNAFGNEIDLDLELNKEIDNNIRLFYADATSDGGINIERVSGDTNMFVGDLYQDVHHQAALLVDHDEANTLQLNGVLDDLVIAPVPRRLHKEYPSPNDDDMLLLEDEEADLSPPDNVTGPIRSRRSTPPLTLGLHVVYRRAANPGRAEAAFLDPSQLDDAAFIEGEDVPSVDQPAGSTREKRSVPDLYPEVLLIVDYETYAVHDYDARTAKKYLMSFMNAVDLRYRSVSYPSITVKVAGIVISKNKEATPYLEENMVGGESLNAVTALESIGRYLFKERRLPSYDAALVITKRDMCTKSNNWGPCKKVTAGYAYVGGGCSISKYYYKINSVALIEDSGGFSGIIVATHELGHLLGSVHDGSPPAPYLGGPGALSCPWADGYIMSDLRRDYKGVQWSICSLDQFAHFAGDRRSRCMQNYPSERSDLPVATTLPGKLISLDAQCKRDRGSSACFKDQRVCAELYCFEESTGYCVSYRPAAEGSRCGEGMHCISGICTPEGFLY